MVACTDEDVTVAFLDWGDEETIFDSQKVEVTLHGRKPPKYGVKCYTFLEASLS